MTTGVDLAGLGLFVLLLATAVGIARMRSLYAAAMLSSLFSLLIASLFVLLDAVDVAFTEAAVGAGISTVLFLTVIALTRSHETMTPRRNRWLPGAVGVTFCGGMLVYASFDLPAFGDPDSPIERHPVTEAYLEDSQRDIGIPNVVTNVLASYRGYDTLGELAVIFTAGIAVLLALRSVPRHAPEFERTLRLKEYRVLRVVSRILIPFILLFALYVQFHGDYGPGGGFQAGVIFASALVLHGLVFGIDDCRRVVPRLALNILIPAGLLLYIGVGVASMLIGGSFLDYSVFNPDHPAEGQHLGILLVELGVGLTVAGVMTAVFCTFAEREVST